MNYLHIMLRRIYSLIKKVFYRMAGVSHYTFNYFSELSKRTRIRRFGSPGTKALVEKGYWLFPDKLSADLTSTLIDEFDELRKARGVEYSGQLNRRIVGQGAITPNLNKLGNSILESFSDLFNGDYAIEISYYQESVPEKNLNDVPGGRFHVDDNKANYKYFIYLTDVSYENGPFSAVPGTGHWRLKGSFWRGLLWEITRVDISCIHS